MSLKSDLISARPGDTILFRGEQRLGKVLDIRGTASGWITLRGEDETAVLIPDPDYLYAVARFEDCAYFAVEKCRVDGEGRAERGLQFFTSERINVTDLEMAAFKEDGIHSAGSNHVYIGRVFLDGAAGTNMGGGKGPHAVYFTRIDGGPDCEDLIAQDIDCVDIWGAAFQANGDGAELFGVEFRRCRALNYGRLGGSGVNLAQCRAPLIEDLILVAHPANDNPGIASYDGTTGTMLVRYDIECNDANWSGPMTATAGEPEQPAPPNFGLAPIPPEPTPEPEAGMQWCPSCDGGKTQLGPDGSLIACATCGGSGTIPLPT